MDEHELEARKLLACTIRDQTRMCSHFACRQTAARLRALHAKTMLEASAIYHLHGVPHSHLGSVEVAGRARALKRQAVTA